MANTQKRITHNFKLSEFNCSCGCDMPATVQRNIELLALRLERIRTVYGSPVIIHSGYRCREYNTRIGGARNSQHIQGKAADFSIPGYGAASVAAAVRHLIATGEIAKGGVGKYPTFTHYDMRGYIANW